MPIYAYKCSSCGHQQDVLQKISEDPLTICPACGQASFAKQVTAAGFQLKGSGWYVTDFRDNGAKKEAKSDSKNDGKSDGKIEGKPAETAGKSDAPAKADGAAAAGSASSASSTGSSPAPAAGGTSQPTP
ncbi:MAG: zinc ribbon domain-containing protein [Burkholderiales bacterium]|jgi:putative FmdB family regulatory protein|nr:zinc ribbon domain-containing protein [Burkholderiales bacterium]